MDRFIQHCVDKNVPVDFVSTHVYGNDSSKDVFGTNENIPRDKMVCRAARKVHDQVKASARPQLPIIWSEYNASYANEPKVTDALFMGPWLADTIRQCDGLTDMMAYWTFSDVFEEQGVVKQPFYGGYGLLAERHLPKPSFNAFKLLHRLGDVRYEVSSDSVLVTQRNDDGSFVIAAWNLFLPDEVGHPKDVTIVVNHNAITGQYHMWRLDNAMEKAYTAMGSPRYPTRSQVEQLRRAAQLPMPESGTLQQRTLHITIPAHGLVLIEIAMSQH